MAILLPRDLGELASFQHDVVTRVQALSSGLTGRQVDRRLDSGRWVALHRGVLLTQPGRADHLVRESAAVLALGRGAVLSRRTVVFRAGLLRPEPALVHVDVPTDRSLLRRDGVRIHRSVRPVDASESWEWPPRTSLEQAVVDLAAESSADQAVALAALACQRGLTWYAALLAELDRRPRHRWRQLLRAALDDIGDGSQSTLEVRFVRDVARPHGLPVGTRQLGSRAGVHDLGYERERVIVELDGRAYHDDPWTRSTDNRRDRRGLRSGWVTVRAGWADVLVHPCDLAGDLAAVLAARGHQEAMRSCRRLDCRVSGSARAPAVDLATVAGGKVDA